MSDDIKGYTLHGVDIYPQPGGYYELHHPSLPVPLRERGKEKAEARAKAISDAFALDEGDEATMAPQGSLENLPSAEQEKESPERDPVIAQDPDAELRERIAQLEAENAQLRTVRVTEGVAPGGKQVPNAIPRRFDRKLDDNAKGTLEKMGVKMTTIILEESPEIPPTGLFLGHNGRGYIIQPGLPVDVPEFLIEVLNNAVMSAPVVDSKTQKVLGYRDRLRYSYRRP